MIMSRAILTLIGLYEHDDTLFDNLTLPDAVDKDVFINNLLVEAGEFSVLYPNFTFMKAQIGAWSLKWKETFDKWAHALSLEFNPIHNYDRYEEWTDSGENSSSNSGTNSNSVTSSGNSTITEGSTTTNKISAYDSSTMQNDTETGFTGSTQNYNTNSDSVSGSVSESSSGDFENSHTGHLYGNIGVTTSMQMLTDYNAGMVKMNLINMITDIFINDFCIMVY